MEPKKIKSDTVSTVSPCISHEVMEETEVERFYEDLQDLLEVTAKKDVFFIIEG